jgi:DNA-binding helix-hairpin-helix protein with protein kinase domain
LTPGSTIRTGSGSTLRLGNILGKGGEGTIFHVDGNSSLAVKIYTDGKQIERLAKLQAMIADGLSSRTNFVSFPLETAHANSGFVGFTMRKAANSKPLFNLCISSARKNEFPEANYRFLVRAALNYARAVASLHSLGAVVGDINESGALVDQTGLVTMIDSDSFQYTSSGIHYRCLVGKAEYTPPELQNKSLAATVRTTNHDAFGLAVILFEILFLGRHPFTGVPQGGEMPTIAEAITKERFAYSPYRSITGLAPPAHMPTLADIPANVSEAFQRAFGPFVATRPMFRPSAAEWVKLLETMEKSIVECKSNPSHYHSNNATRCPWCNFESGLAVVLFVQNRASRASNFDLNTILLKIENITHPGPEPELSRSQSNCKKYNIKAKREENFSTHHCDVRRIIGILCCGPMDIFMFRISYYLV